MMNELLEFVAGVEPGYYLSGREGRKGTNQESSMAKKSALPPPKASRANTRKNWIFLI